MTRFLNLCFALLLTSCATFQAKKYHTAAITAPSVDPVKQSIGDARTQVTAMRKGNDRIDYKAGRAMEFFPRP